MKGERRVGGLLCSEVLAFLPDVVSGEIGAEAKAQVEAHLAGCSVCTAFGGSYAEAAARMRTALAVDVPDDVVGRLAARVLESVGKSSGE